jgi:hypothetical protein
MSVAAAARLAHAQREFAWSEQHTVSCTLVQSGHSCRASMLLGFSDLTCRCFMIMCAGSSSVLPVNGGNSRILLLGQ